jgi:hypothetical protein
VEVAIATKHSQWLEVPEQTSAETLKSLHKWIINRLRYVTKNGEKGMLEVPWPIPAETACYEGGTCSAQLYEEYNTKSEIQVVERPDEIAESIQYYRSWKAARVEQAERARVRKEHGPRMDETGRIDGAGFMLGIQFNVHAGKSGLKPTPTAEEIGKYALEKTARLGPQPFRACAIKELGGKVRVATIHTAAQMHAARVLSQRTLGALKRIGMFKKILKGEKTELKRDTHSALARLFSADLTAATEYLRFDVNRTVIDALAEALSWTELEKEAAQNIMGPQLCDIDNVLMTTRQGGLLGLGLSWSVLSLVNAFCATRYAAEETLEICGDDLIGLWTPKEIASYRKYLIRVGLKSNITKEFVGLKGGVFCERMVTAKWNSRKGYDMARGGNDCGIAEASGARGDFGGINTAGTIGDLHKLANTIGYHRHIKALAQSTWKRKGGRCGDLPAHLTNEILLGAIKHGTISKTKCARNPMYKLERYNYEPYTTPLKPKGKAVLVRDLIVDLTTWHGVDCALSGVANPYKKEAVSSMKHRRLIIGLSKNQSEVSCKKLCLAAAAAKHLPSWARRRIILLIKSSSFNSGRTRRRIYDCAGERPCEWLSVATAGELYPRGTSLQSGKIRPPKWRSQLASQD